MTTTNSAAAVSTTATKTANDDKKATVDYESFLKLLTAQLRNQDPLAPMDATQFMTQLAQLSTVEQSMKTNDTLGEVLSTLKSSGMRMDMAFVGRKVEAASDSMALAEGKAETAYTIDGAAASVKVEVVNAAGTVVYSGTGATGTGRQTFTWNGRTTSGGTAPDGLYTVRITAKDKDGKALESAAVTSGVVSEVRSVDGNTQLVLKNGITVPGDAVLSAS